MTRRALFVLTAVTTALLLLTVAYALGAPQLGDAEADENGAVEREIALQEPRIGEEASLTSAPADGLVWVGLPALGSTEDEDGEVVFCRRTRWVRVEPQDRDETRRNAESSLLGLFRGLPELQGHNPFLECPVDPTEAIPAVVLRDAIRHTIRDDLPRPVLEVPPGYALTGMPAFLVTNHQLTYGPVNHTVDLGIAVLNVTVSATGVTHVDWGDGFSETYHSPGTPWPDGQVVHTYRDARSVDITVTDTWQVTYRVPALGIEDGVEAALPSRTLESFEVRQMQAVRTTD